jgi:hypothetical protein
LIGCVCVAVISRKLAKVQRCASRNAMDVDACLRANTKIAWLRNGA